MESLLDPALAALPELLKDKAAWQSLYIDYEPPFLMRLYLPVIGGERTVYLSLHYFFGAADRLPIANPYEKKPELIGAESANNYHPHPWASAFHLFQGSYQQDIGLAAERGYSADPASPLRPQPGERKEQQAGDPQKNRYAFKNPLIWHRVLPNDGRPVTTLMLTYIPEGWDQTGPRPPVKQRCLTEAERAFMFAHFGKILCPRPPSLQPKGPS